MPDQRESGNLEDGNKVIHLINFEWIGNTEEMNKKASQETMKWFGGQMTNA